MLMLSHVWDGRNVDGWLASEKLDGMRCYWDGGISRGMLAKHVPYANTEKDFRLVNSQVVATGLWSRHGKVINAPDWFVETLPYGLALDGELYIGRGQFQTLMSTVRMITPGPDWATVRYKVFDSPPLLHRDWSIDRMEFLNLAPPTAAWSFQTTYDHLFGLQDRLGRMIDLVEQVPIIGGAMRVGEMVDQIVASGGEGLMLRRPGSFWEPTRSWNLLKVKPYLDSEGIVMGYTWGLGKFSGMMGSLLVATPFGVFGLSGFTDAERELTYHESVNVIAGSECSGAVTSRMFPRGATVTYKYRELTKEGLPKEARYFRQVS